MGLLFESETCTRCGGTGKHSYCQTYGDTCFKCHGQKETLTKRGQEAQRYYRESCKIKVEDVKVGDFVRCGRDQGIVQEIRETIQKGASLKDGVMVPYESKAIIIKLPKLSIQMLVGGNVEVPSKELKLKALEYQEKLTKKGELRKKYQK